MTADTPVGIVGLGLMGIALSARLVDAKIPLVGFDIDPVRCGMFKATGGTVASSARELAACSRTIIVAVYCCEQVAALFGEIDDGAGAARPVVICITTCGPGEIIGIAERASRAGLPLLEAPISGTSVEVLDGTATALSARGSTSPPTASTATSRTPTARFASRSTAATSSSCTSAMPAGPNSRSI